MARDMTMAPSCQALDILETLVGEKPAGPENTLIVHCRDGSTLTLTVTPPPSDQPQSGTLH